VFLRYRQSYDGLPYEHNIYHYNSATIFLYSYHCSYHYCTTNYCTTNDNAANYSTTSNHNFWL
jgi:hypothetical protein